MAAEGSIDPETPDGGDRPARSESPHSSSAHNQPILPIPAKLQGQIDHSAWGKLLDFDNNPEPSEGQTTAHIGFLVECWRESNTTGPSLWQEFKDEFEEWTDEQWANLPRRIGTWLRSFLVANGVMMEEDSRIYGQLRQTARREEYKEWSDDDITRISKTNKEFRLNLSDREFVQDIQGTLPPWKETVSATTPTIRPPPPSTVSQQAAILSTSQHTPATTAAFLQVPRAPDNSQPVPQTQGHWQGTAVPSPVLLPHVPPPVLLPQEPAAGPLASPKQITDLAKLYTSDDMKFGGEMYDVLDTKLVIFRDCCHRVGIQQWQAGGAFPTMLRGRALQFYYDRLCDTDSPRDLPTMVRMMKTHFESEESKQMYLSQWRETTLIQTIEQNPGKPKTEALEILLDKLTKIQRALPTTSQTTEALRLQVLNACRGVGECTLCLFNPAPTYEGVCNQLRSAISIATSVAPQQFVADATAGLPPEQYWTDRRYNGRGRDNRFGRDRGRNREYGGNRPSRGFTPSRPSSSKKCYVCGKTGCWSTTHTPEERRKAYDRFKNNDNTRDKSANAYAQFLAWHEGIVGVEDEPDDDSVAQFFQGQEQDDDPDDDNEQFYTTFLADGEPVNPYEITTLLADVSVRHGLTREDPYGSSHQQKQEAANDTFTLEGRYSSTTFQGIMPDSGAAVFSTAGHPQFRALQREMPEIQLDQSTAGNATVRFGRGDALISLGTTTVPTPLGPLEFHVMPSNTPFLLCLQDMDRLGITFDNLHNVLHRGGLRVPVTRKWGHAWLHVSKEKTLACNYLTEGELRRLHRRFGHPSVTRLHKVLQASGHPVEIKALEFLTKVCHQCQMNAQRPTRFKFTLRDDCEFNYELIIDIMYLDGNKPVLHVVDTATAFNAARFLKDITAKRVWETLRLCWIDVYQGPPDWIVTDAGTQFRSAEFRQHAREMGISIKEVPIEAHNSIGKVERYHAPLRRAYQIICAEAPSLGPDAALQMAVKATNDTAGPDGIVPTLLVFGAYPRMTEDSAPSPDIRQRAHAVHKATQELRRLHARRQVSDALAMRNGPDTSRTTHLPIHSLVRVWREKLGWQGPYKLLSTDGEDCTVELDRGPQTFRSTTVKPYHEDPGDDPPEVPTPEDRHLSPTAAPHTGPQEEPTIVVATTAPSASVPEEPRRPRGRPRKHPLPQVTFLQETDVPEIFLTVKEAADAALAVDLRAQGKISTPGEPFEESAQQEIESLIARGVFEFVLFDRQRYGSVRIFKSRIVNEVKGKTTSTPYEKSRLVVQGYGDDGKEAILTQSPTIQRASQRLILCLMPSLLQRGMCAWLRDITQAYVQSETPLNRTILAYLPTQIKHHYPEGTVMRVIKPLYGLAEAGTHWWATYHNHHVKKLQMTTSTYDPCLLISTPENPDFACVGMQTDDTLGMSTTSFSLREDEQLKEAAFTAKPKQVLSEDEPLAFNGGVVTLTEKSLTLRQKGQAKRLQPVDPTSPNAKQQYVEQRARGAYIASICQPEACFDLSSAAQHQDPTPDDMRALNRRIEWQMKYQDRGLTFAVLDLLTARLFVFVDGSFANNRDLTSQLGFAIILGNEAMVNERNEFTLTGNLIHFSSTKSKRVTRSVLASEVYGMVAGVDMAYALASTIRMITAHLDLPPIQTIVCTDSYSLYECLVKLGTTKEKRLMIDIMALRQSYERRELHEVRWINGDDNLADAFTKKTPNRALTQFVDTNQATIRLEGWVSR
ncbi:MAG: polyprotein [Massilia sp.]|nr:polyprotein [Massilia sp.]